MIRTSGPRGAPAGQEQLVSRYEYEPVFNQPIRITDPRGHVAKLTYDAANMRITNNVAANQYLTREYRPGFGL